MTSQENDAPEGRAMSSGDSAIQGRMVEIDNYKNMNGYLENREYYFLEKIVTMQEDEYPQGLCFSEDFIFISSYSGKRKDLGKIKVFDKESGEYLISLGVDEDSHLGGLAYDGKDIWICNPSKMCLERISYSYIKKLTYENRGELIDVRNIVEEYRIKNIPSSVAYYDGQLWVATHSVLTNSIMVGYYYNEGEERLESSVSLWIPSKVQGIAFKESGEVLFSISYGRRKTSYIRKYESLHVMTRNVDDYVEQIELPPCSEGIVCENEKIYVLFESAAKKFLEGSDGKGKSTAPINKILVIRDR